MQNEWVDSYREVYFPQLFNLSCITLAALGPLVTKPYIDTSNIQISQKQWYSLLRTAQQSDFHGVAVFTSLSVSATPSIAL